MNITFRPENLHPRHFVSAMELIEIESPGMAISTSVDVFIDGFRMAMASLKYPNANTIALLVVVASVGVSYLAGVTAAAPSFAAVDEAVFAVVVVVVVVAAAAAAAVVVVVVVAVAAAALLLQLL